MKATKSSREAIAIDLKLMDMIALTQLKNLLTCPSDSCFFLEGTNDLQESTKVTNNTDSSGIHLWNIFLTIYS